MTTRYSRNALEMTRLRKLYSNAYIQKKVRLWIPGPPTATRYSRNALESLVYRKT